MLQEITQIQYHRDDQLPEKVHYKAVHQRFRLEEARVEIVDLDGANLVVLNPGKKCYLIYRCASKDVLRQIWELLKQVSISMYMKVPLQKDERIAGEEQFLPDKKEKKLLKRSLHPD